MLAVPVPATESLAALRTEVDDTVCLAEEDDLGAFYRDFRQLRDHDVVDLLDRARGWTDAEPRPTSQGRTP